MKYVIMTNPNGFQLNGNAIAEYGSAQEAMKHMGPGDVIVPIADEVDVVDFQTGKERLPVFNRSGNRDRR
jgi:hypothetical protein